MAATDEESDTLTYTLGGTDAASFDIDTATGQIKTKDALDYEGGTTTYNVTVSVSDGKDINDNAEDPPTEDATIDVTINLTDANEPPAFDANAPATQTVAENTAAETDIGSPYTATDPEGDTPLTYSLGGTDATSFSIDETSGQLKTKVDLDHETKDTYTVDVQVADGKDAAGTAETPPVPDTTHTVIITVTDADDPGSITLSTQTPIVGSTVTATVVDQDDGLTGETWVWEKSDDGQSNWTAISGATSDSYTPVAGDDGSYLRVTVTYTDDDGAGKTANAEATSAVTTAPATNEHPEFADATATREIAEGDVAGRNIGEPVTATHADSKGTLVYSLGGTDDTSFAIDTTTGQLKTNADLDHETKNEYTVTVSVSDGMDSYEETDTVVDDTIEVTITVTDVNEPPAFADDAPATQDVPENTATDVSIGSPYTASDPDVGETLTYSLGGTDAASFAIDTNGQLKTKAALDHETDDSYSVTIQVTDGKAADGTADTVTDDTHAVTITVIDVDEDGAITLSRRSPVGGYKTDGNADRRRRRQVLASRHLEVGKLAQRHERLDCHLWRDSR